MKRFKLNEHIIECVHWLAAIVISFLIVNMLTFPLYHSAGWITLNGAPVEAISEPNQVIVNSDEGYGINRMDSNGFSNPSTNLSEDGYVLAMGSSITKASQVNMDKHYTSILNSMLGGADNNLKIYNLGQEGATFDSMAKHFSAAVGEYPKTNAITIEFCILGVDSNDLKDGFSPIEWIPGSVQDVDITKAQQLKFAVKRYFPLMSFFIENRLPNIKLSFNGAFGITNSFNVNDENDFTLEDYESYFRTALSFIREQYSGRIVLVYIPAVELDNDGIYVVPKPEIELLLKVAPEYNIEILDASSVFLEAYQNDYIFPLGYWNTHYGSGHMNADGHQIIADSLYEMLGE